MTNMKSHMGFPLTPRSMTLDDLELHKFEFFSEFRGISQISDATTPGIVSDNVVSTSNWSNFWQTFASRGFVSDSWAFLFTARRYASGVIATATCLFVCPSVRPSVTRRYCVKTKKASGMISSLSGSPKTLVF